jgi:hypothetical protein
MMISGRYADAISCNKWQAGTLAVKWLDRRPCLSELVVSSEE